MQRFAQRQMVDATARDAHGTDVIVIL